MKKFLLIAAVAATLFSCKTTKMVAPGEVADKLGENPHFIVNGQASDKSALQTINAEEVASLTTYYGKEATQKYGDKAKDGAVEIETKAYSKEKYQQVFKAANSDYKNKLEAEGNDSNFQYILNGKPLTDNYEGNLAGITPSLLKKIKVIGIEELTSKYQISGKSAGIIIKASPPKNLYHGKEKFNKR